ncbi:hypothetical protein PQZ12_01545 [Methylophilaceae bacterium]|jgi:hypothetical protein|nr:hypothetical protein [Methylophilaceae bacterium]
MWKIAKVIIHPSHNPLKHAPKEYAFMATLVLACFWCLSFGLYMGEYLAIGESMLGHIAIITMVFVTLITFQSFKKKYKSKKKI